MDPEKQYMEDLKANGVDLPELEEKADDPQEPEKEPEEPATDPDPEKSEGDEPEDDTQTPEEPRKRSIYQEYKEKKSELKTEKELREQAEKQRDELQAKLDAIANASDKDNPSSEEVLDAVAYAEKIGADPDLVKQIIADARKGVKTELDPEVAKSLERFQKWEQENKQQLDKQAFEAEFSKITPVIKEFFPTVNDSELKSIKENLDKLSHSKEWYDKDLEYIVFKNRDTLSTLVSPRKRGMESRERKDEPTDSFEFDSNADLSKMTPLERDKWETEFRKAAQTDSLMTSSNGKKFLI